MYTGAARQKKPTSISCFLIYMYHGFQITDLHVHVLRRAIGSAREWKVEVQYGEQVENLGNGPNLMGFHRFETHFKLECLQSAKESTTRRPT